MNSFHTNLVRHYWLDMPCVYVGQTGQSPEEQFADYKRGGFTASRCVEK